MYTYRHIFPKPNARYEDARFKLPNYTDKDEAVSIFVDFSRLKSVYIPFVEWRRLPYKGPTTTIDNNHIRVHPAHARNLKRSTKVAFFGGSAMWGTGVADSETIPALFEYLSNKYTSTNFGEAGYNSRQNLEMMLNLINANEKIDIAVFYDGVNDTIGGCSPDLSLNSHFAEWTIRKQLTRSPEPNFLSLIEPTWRFVESIKEKISRESKAEPRYLCDKDLKKAEAAADLMLNNWNHARTIAESRGMRFYAILQPVAYIGSPQTKHLDLSENLGKQFRAVYPILKRKIAERSVSWIFDLTDSFDSNEYVYIDYCHVSKNGNKIIAKKLLEHLAN